MVPTQLSRRRFLLSAVALAPAPAKSVRLADIEFQVLRNGRAARRYLLIHGNEQTAREVLTEHLQRFKGTAHLVAGRQRIVTAFGGRIDPNRLFSREGAARSYRRYNPTWSEAELTAALNQLDRARPKLLKALLPKGGALIIAVHNNSEGYNVKEEAPISDAVHLPRPAEPHEFFLASSRSDFELLAKGPFNAVLQANPKGEEDGSLSRLCARRGIRYVNLEAALGKADIQREMLEWLEKTLP